MLADRRKGDAHYLALDRSPAQEAVNEGVDFVAEEGSSGEDFTAVKPWMGNLVEPTDAGEQGLSAPTESCALDWAYGYQAQNMRNSLRYVQPYDVLVVCPHSRFHLLQVQRDRRHALHDGVCGRGFLARPVDSKACLAQHR
jgi:hypothetical protein